ncbi:MAG: family 65 glycosyl hydrolase [Actinobacteria bacterium 13_2_20CM_2_71_6]|nr:MAG: family 65 glycosyl hydrolase [Actinobacteria bacterium 13_2_20CM_2_71_6]
MISQKQYPVEPWAVRETDLDLRVLAQSESVFALSNGHIGMRANLDEGEPHALPGTYLNSVYEQRPLPYAEAGYGYPPFGQTVINVTNGKLIRLLVNDEPFDVRYGRVRRHERVLDLQAGVLRRECEWTSPSGVTVQVNSTRLVSFVYRSIAAICYEVRAVSAPIQVVLQSELVANEQLPAMSGDPRAAAVLEAPLRGEQHGCDGHRVVMIHQTNRSQLRVGAGMDHVVECGSRWTTGTTCDEDTGRFTVTARLAPGESLRIVKFLAYGWSSQRSLPAIRAQVEAALTAALASGWDWLLAAQRDYLDDFWNRADVELDGDDEVQQAVRFALFHVLQASARAEQRPIPAKGLTGTGYDGHAFWDTETFVLPVLTYTAPGAATDALRWRQMIIPKAKERAEQLGLRGTAFPWRTIVGGECSAYWPAGTAAFHINADIADAVIRTMWATQDDMFAREAGVELLVETARLWMSLGALDADGRFHIDGVTGPDEYSSLADNNVYTNLMAQRNLRGAADAAQRYRERAAALDVTEDEVAAWRRAADGVVLVYDERLRVHPQAAGFTSHAVWDFANTPEDRYPLLLHYPYFQLYRQQVVKQADLVLALHLRSDAFTPEEKLRDFDYYEGLTVRDSSLSACTQAVMAAEVGHLDLAYDYLGEAALMDLGDLEHNTRDGVHIASLAGAWLAIVAGLGGMRDQGDVLRFAPHLAGPLRRLCFALTWRGRRLRVEVNAETATYGLIDGDEAMELMHEGERLIVKPGQPVSMPVRQVPDLPRPSQPPGREPRRRH